MSDEKYVELCKNSFTNRNNLFRKSDITLEVKDYPCYVSIFSYTEDIVSYYNTNIIEKKNTIANYNGEVFLEYLWLDIDNDDLAVSTTRCKEILGLIYGKYGIGVENLQLFFSGSKGYHVGIPSFSFKANGVLDKNNPAICRLMAAYIVDAYFNENDVPVADSVDFSKYTTTSILRLPNSKNDKSIYYKTPIDGYLILEENLEKIKELSKTCTTEIPYRYNPIYSEELYQLYVYCKDYVENDKDEILSGFFSDETINKNTSIFRIPDKGNRNDMLYKQAYRLFSIPAITTPEANDLMRLLLEVTNYRSAFFNQRQVQELEFRNYVKSAFRRARHNASKEIEHKTAEQMTAEMFKFIKELKWVDTGVKSFDDDLSPIKNRKAGLIAGNSYSFIGKGGTKKSILAQMICIQAALRDELVIYFNLEMSEFDFFSRLYLMLFGISFAELIDNGEITEENLQFFVDKLKEALKGNMIIISEKDLTVENLDTSVKRIETLYKKKVRLCVVDSMNAMGMVGNELNTAVIVSKGVKDFAKANKLAVILINHVTQACSYHFRDTSGYVRGGAKVIDNCDAYFCFSLIVDEANSNMSQDHDKRDVKYRRELFFVRFVNKRGSGNVTDEVFQLDDSLKAFRIAPENLTERIIDDEKGEIMEY